MCFSPGQSLGRGTKITLYIKKDQDEYLEEKRIKEVVREHCGFCSYLIKLGKEEKESSEEEDEYEEKKVINVGKN